MNVAIISMVRPIHQQAEVDENHPKTVVCPNTTFLWSLNDEEEDTSVNVPQVNIRSTLWPLKRA